MTDALAARRFVTLHARLIDRRRMDGDPALVDLAGWLETVTHPDGGLDFVLPFDPDAIPHAPWMTPPPERASSLHMTAAVTAAAHRAGMGAGPGRTWLDRASAFVWRR